MNSMEEKLWNYIDGTCTPEQQEAIAQLIAHDELYRIKYNELLALHTDFANIELDEPPMAFSYNVMEQIRTEYADKPLKAAIDTRIIKGIAAFFIITIGVLVVFALGTATWQTGPLINLDWKMPEFRLPQLNGLLTTPLVQGFLFFDMVFALYLFDAWLRRKKTAKAV